MILLIFFREESTGQKLSAKDNYAAKTGFLKAVILLAGGTASGMFSSPIIGMPQRVPGIFIFYCFPRVGPCSFPDEDAPYIFNG